MSAPRDVILLTIDSLRADHCGFMQGTSDLTPALDGLAGDGLVFENAVAPAPATNTSVATMLTGQYPNPSIEAGSQDYTERIRHHMRARGTIAERFSDLGYTTGAFTANPWTARFFNYDCGFDHFEDFMDENLSSGLVEAGGEGRGVIGEAISLLLNWYQGQDMFMSWDAYADDIEAWLASVESPYFLWVFLVDVHMPYLPPAEYRSRSRLLGYPANAALFAGRHSLPLERLFRPILLEAYRDTVAYTDTFLKRLTEVTDDPLIAVSADHGEAFGEGGIYGHGPAVSEELVHVPFVVGNGPDRTITDPVSLRVLPDLLPTLARGGSPDSWTATTVWTRNYDPAIAVRGRDWRYRWRPSDEVVAVDGTDGWVETDAPALADLGRTIVESKIEAERERQRIQDAACTLGGELAP